MHFLEPGPLLIYSSSQFIPSYRSSRYNNNNNNNIIVCGSFLEQQQQAD